MIATAKDLRFNISMLFDVLNKGEDILITYRGKAKAKLISIKDEDSVKSDEMFGMWRDEKEDVDETVRTLRSGRSFDI